MKTTGIRILIATILLGAWAPPLPAAGRRSVRLLPAGAQAVGVRIDGKEKEYYLLRKDAPLNLQVDGPGRLTVTSRLNMTALPGGTARYGIRVREGKNVLKVQSTQTEPSEATFAGSGAPAGKSRKMTIRVPEGSFTYVISLEETGQDAAVRFTFEPAKDARRRTAIEPLSYDRVVTAAVNEKLLAYYVASPSRPVTLRVVGPTRVRVTTRLNYDEKMKGGQKFSIVVTEKGKPVLTRPLQTTKSVGLSYKEWREVVPGKARAFSFDVPAGDHVYSFSLDQALARSVSLRLSIPRDDVANEE